MIRTAPCVVTLPGGYSDRIKSYCVIYRQHFSAGLVYDLRFCHWFEVNTTIIAACTLWSIINVECRMSIALGLSSLWNTTATYDLFTFVFLHLVWKFVLWAAVIASWLSSVVLVLWYSNYVMPVMTLFVSSIPFYNQFDFFEKTQKNYWQTTESMIHWSSVRYTECSDDKRRNSSVG